MPNGQVVDASPIINDPFLEPDKHWHFGEGSPVVREGRRISGFLPPATREGELSITDDVVPMPVVNDLRDRVRRWRDDNYAGATLVTRDLLDRWFDDERVAGTRPFFAQREAIETIVFLTEATPDRLVGVDLPNGGEAYLRLAVKMATGTGKTLVMAMAIAWSALNKAANPQDTRFADAILVVCPNLTVKERLGGLDPQHADNEYVTFGLIPPNLASLLGQARVLVTNWHALSTETDPRRSVLRRGEESDAAFCRRVIEPQLGRKQRILVINDEAHHAYRRKPGAKVERGEMEDLARATVWIDGLARVHRNRGILRCLDFSATPMFVPGSGHDPWTPFPWIVSDFPLVDSIECGLVKIPRIPTDDNSGASVPKYRDLWEHVKQSLPRPGKDGEEGSALTDYLTQVDGPLRQLASEWSATLERWRGAGRPVPPVLIIICSDTRMAEVLEQYVAIKGRATPELQNRDDEQRTVRIDSRLLAEAEDRDDETAEDQAERIRRVVATVGKPGEPGALVRCLISVQMLSEGWDARNVTHILGLRAFTSQLLCEQVVGRGLRRSSYDNLGEPEYVDVYGVPFQLLPFAKATPGRVIAPPRTTSVVALSDRKELRIVFPRVVSIVQEVGTHLQVDWEDVVPVVVDPANDPTVVTVKGLSLLDATEQSHASIWAGYRRNRLLFELASRLISGQAQQSVLFPQALAVMQTALATKVTYNYGIPEAELDNELYKNQLVIRVRGAMRSEHDDGIPVPVLDEYEAVGSTDSVRFVTAKDVEPTVKSHVSHVVCDSELERGIALELETDARVVSYVKNDHLFCEIPYRFEGRTLRYLPDFLVRSSSGQMLLIEGKGQERMKDQAKEGAARRWIKAVSADGRWGQWSHHVVHHRAEVDAALKRY